MALKVLIAGGGLGGLCLAQGLRRAGVRTRVFERDASVDVRGQGYRLRIDEQGISALAQCLPDDLFQLFRATTNPPQPPRGVAFDHHLEQISLWDTASGPAHGTSQGIATDTATATAQGTSASTSTSTVANRRTLREILLAGLGDTVEFNCEVVGAEEIGGQAVGDKVIGSGGVGASGVGDSGVGGGGVLVRLADGRTVAGDVLIAADGINSVLRANRLPHATLLDTGLRGIYGHAVLNDHLRGVLPDMLCVGSPPVLGPDGVTLAIGVFRPAESPQRAARRIAPYARLSHVADYVKWTLVASPTTLGLTEPDVWTAEPVALHDIARRITAEWHPALAELVRCADPPSTFAVAIQAALPVGPWPSSRITLLGDAIHATTPAGGTGANVALRDAAALTECLTAADRGHIGVLDAIATYEERMRQYGFAAATRSLRSAELIFRVRLPVPV